jgi:PadR family transcriptional regulator, regulatory protein PadR
MGDPIVEAAAKKGSAELLILASLEEGQLHGYDIAREISRRSGGLLTFHVASLYPLLYKLEDRTWIAGRWVEKTGQRRRRYYRLTAEGRKVLAQQRSRWEAFVGALTKAAGLRPV